MKRVGWLVLRLAVGGLFIYAGSRKALDPLQFLLDVRSFQLTPYWAAAAVAHYLPFLEIVCGAALIVRKARAGAVAILLAAVTVFLAAILSAWARGIDISCGCFGAGTEAAGYPWLAARDGLFLAALAILALAERKDYKDRCHAR